MLRRCFIRDQFALFIDNPYQTDDLIRIYEITERGREFLDDSMRTSTVPPGAWLHERVFLHLPTIAEVTLTHPPPSYFLRCAAPPDSVSNSPRAGTLCFPPRPSDPYAGIAFLGLWTLPSSCWRRVFKVFFSFFTTAGKEVKTCRHLRGPWTHNPSENLKLPGSKCLHCTNPGNKRQLLEYISFLHMAQVGDSVGSGDNLPTSLSRRALTNDSYIAQLI